LVGVDDAPIARDAALTTIRIPVEAMGRESIRGLVRMLHGEAGLACRTALTVSNLVVRASTTLAPSTPQPGESRQVPQ
jgi:DNA-binding LacI/PurR family transcriptional regulator